MPESELAKKITKLIKATDKLTRDILKDTQKLSEALRELKELRKSGEDEKSL